MRSSLCCSLIAVALAFPVMAKLAPLDDEGKAKAAETAAKSAWTDKVGLYKHCLAQDRIAKNYRKTATNAPSPVETAPCADPGPFATAVTPVAAKPIEASGAHSPSGTAISPPSTKAPAAEVTGNSKATPVTPVKDKPLEAAEAHSPPGTAISPPSTNATNAELTGKSKK